ncbi:hypothetical protein IWX65_001554 [Arthrobacter sp. CAN_A214]|uniref:hypothetical protein n=1 Tax=Arthrobacter sp. CAN_A214 TaxID=2787720 RepID=UPI0018C92899
MTDLIFRPFHRGIPDAPVLHLSQTPWGVRCCYTTGRTEQGLPELYFCGPSDAVLRSAGRHLAELPEHPIRGTFSPGSAFEYRAVRIRESDLHHLPNAGIRYGFAGFEAVQLYLVMARTHTTPSAQQLGFLASQPYLGTGTLGHLLD